MVVPESWLQEDGDEVLVVYPKSNVEKLAEQVAKPKDSWESDFVQVLKKDISKH
jgi:hypothetical protein